MMLLSFVAPFWMPVIFGTIASNCSHGDNYGDEQLKQNVNINSELCTTLYTSQQNFHVARTREKF